MYYKEAGKNLIEIFVKYLRSSLLLLLEKKCREYFRKRWFCVCLMHFLHFSYVIVHNLINNSQRQKKREQKKDYSLLKNNFFRFRYYYTMNEHFHSKISEWGVFLEIASN